MSQNPLFMRINNYLDAFEIFWSEWVVGYDEVIQESLFRDLQQKSDLWTALGKRWLYEKAQAAKAKTFTLSRLKMIAFLLLTGTLGGMGYLLVIWIRGKQVLKKALHRGSSDQLPLPRGEGGARAPGEGEHVDQSSKCPNGVLRGKR